MTYWDQEKECMARDNLEKLQLRRLKETVFRSYAFVPAYRAKMDAAGIKPDDVNTLGDLQKLPFTTKQEMRDNYPFGLFAVPMSEVVRIHASSGTTGKPSIGCTRKDVDTWADLMARALVAPADKIGDSGSLWIRVIYQTSIWSGAARSIGYSGIRWQYPAPNFADAGFRIHSSSLHPVICAVYRRSDA